MKNKNLPIYLLLTMSMLEGGAVMVCELISAKMLAPYFGTSIAVWAIVLGLTLAGLTTGYYTGGKLTLKSKNPQNMLLSILAIAGLLLAALPVLGIFVMDKTVHLSLEAGAFVSLLVYMVPPLILMGMVSPMIIHLLTHKAVDAGNNAGNVYAISTVGGILATFLYGLLLIPSFGLFGPCIVAGLILFIVPVLQMGKTWALTGIFLMALVAVGLLSANKPTHNKNYRLLYESDGIMGQLRVVDHPSYEFTEPPVAGRALIVNNTIQTYVDSAGGYKRSIWKWMGYFESLVSAYPEKSDILLLGLGGGTLVHHLSPCHPNIDVVEIDPRIPDISRKYFGLDPKIKVTIDDARHFIRTAEKKYDIIIFDTFLSESVPEHLITHEGINDARKILNNGGMLLINFYGPFEGIRGKAARSVAKTLLRAGLHVRLLPTPGTDENRNLLFIATPMEPQFDREYCTNENVEKPANIAKLMVYPSDVDTTDALNLIDARPALSKMYLPIARDWKKGYNRYYREYFVK